MNAQTSLIFLKNPLNLGFSGSLGNIDAYITAVNRIPMLTLDEEISISLRFRTHGDLSSAQSLVLSHLRVVVSIARGYLGYGLPHSDLIQEGNIGLMKAVKRFDPNQGVRLVSYAIHWIKAEMHEYILKNWRLVRVATTKAQRKLFFKVKNILIHQLFFYDFFLLIKQYHLRQLNTFRHLMQPYSQIQLMLRLVYKFYLVHLQLQIHLLL